MLNMYMYLVVNFQLISFFFLRFEKREYNSPRTVQNLDFTRQTTDIIHFAVVFHYVVISI